jgi:hypothetical protein
MLLRKKLAQETAMFFRVLLPNSAKKTITVGFTKKVNIFLT